MNDLLSRKPWDDGQKGDWINEAADEIERLTRQLAEARAALRGAEEDAQRIAGSISGGNESRPVYEVRNAIRARIARLDAEEPKP